VVRMKTDLTFRTITLGVVLSTPFWAFVWWLA
jgi:hypothetical protein